MAHTPLALSFGLALTVAACGPGLTYEEAQIALDEAEVSSQASALTSSSIEITTDFTIGDAAEAAADEVRTFIASQLPCAVITLAAATLTIEYGANPGNCTYHGQTYSGSHAVTISSNQTDSVIVEHVWDELQNETVMVSGTATVTWDFAAVNRNVVHETEWTRLEDGFTATGSGDRTQEPLDGGLLTGFSVDGSRAWTSDNGTWDLAINEVEMRWVDAVPQAGSYVLDTPYGAELTMTFDRIDDTTIGVDIDTGRRVWEFEVTTLPDI